MVRKILIITILTLLLPNLVIAGDSFQAKKPLMIIRFNKEHVRFEKHLQKAADKAREVKPTVNFEILSLIKTNDKDTIIEETNIAHSNAKHVAEILVQSGVNPKNITILYQKENGINNNEIYIFVK